MSELSYLITTLYSNLQSKQEQEISLTLFIATVHLDLEQPIRAATKISRGKAFPPPFQEQITVQEGIRSKQASRALKVAYHTQPVAFNVSALLYLGKSISGWTLYYMGVFSFSEKHNPNLKCMYSIH